MKRVLRGSLILNIFPTTIGFSMSVAGIVSGSVLVIPRNAAAQPAAPALNFEVASIKEAKGDGVSGGCHGINSVYTPNQKAQAPSLGRCVITDARLSHLIGIAYGVSMLNLKTGPDWIQRGDLRFNVVAKTENPSKTTEQQLLIMLQNLLVDRFQLKFHYEPGEAAGFALRVAKNGPKFRVSRSEDTSVMFTGPTGEVLLSPLPGRPNAITARKYSIRLLIKMLSLLGKGEGVDETNLTGEYDFTLAWNDTDGPDLSTAVREQLGLRLDPTKVPVSTFVVDSAHRPSPN